MIHKLSFYKAQNKKNSLAEQESFFYSGIIS